MSLEFVRSKVFPFHPFLSFSLRLCVSAVIFFTVAAAQGLPVANPASVGMNAAKLEQIEPLVLADIKDKKLPGAVVVVGHKGRIVYRKAFGNRSLVPTVEKMTVDTIFDVASLTKPVATATSIMILVEQGKLRLNDTIGKFIPDIDDKDAKSVTIQQLLTHTSGYRPDFDLGEKWTGREGMLAALKKEKLRNPPGTRFVYSDIGFIVLGEVVSRLSIDLLVRENAHLGPFLYFTRRALFSGVGMNDTNFFDDSDLQRYQRKILLTRIAPTENIRGQNSYLGSKFEGDDSSGNEILRGAVHDPTSFRMGGVAGHAGLFSTADDLARYCQMILNGGAVLNAELGTRNAESARNPQSAIRNPQSRRVLSSQTIARMTQPYVVAEDGSTRGLGWDMGTSFS
ncbi:MAG TPA: serine hydrolase domain-containing protein, partial [Pyrinomonadaceae bacterium]|nr:serine hydrolase domain-containing protein [Pyrinomonadaceae bacterium]